MRSLCLLLITTIISQVNAFGQLSASISVSGNCIGTTVTLDGSGSSGGVPPYTYAWDTNNDGIFSDGNSSAVNYFIPLYAIPGNVYVVCLKVTDANNNTVTTCSTVGPVVICSSTPGAISTFAGNGIGGFNGDGLTKTSTQFLTPISIVKDASGNFYVADYAQSRIRKIATDGIVTTIAGTSINGYNGDNILAQIAQLSGPASMALDFNSGDLLIAEFTGNRIRKINSSGVITTIAGTGIPGYNGDGILATSAQLNGPHGIAVDANGNIYIAEYHGSRIRKINSSGIISTIAGTGVSGYNGDGLPATSAQLNTPSNIALDLNNNVFIADLDASRIRKINSSGIISTIAGTGVYGYNGDGINALAAQLKGPHGIALDGNGNIYIADYLDHRVRKVNSSGIISSIAGTGTQGYNGDGIFATTAQLNTPNNVFVDADGSIFIIEGELGHRIRKITSACSPINVTTSVSQNGAGAVAPQTMVFSGAGQNVTFTSGGTGPKRSGGKTFMYSNVNTSGYNGLWWTFTPIANPRHSSQGATGNMAFSGYNAATGIITFTSTSNMTWAANSGTENIATRMRVQLQPYTGTHSGPLASGFLTPVTAGGISLASLPAGYPLMDIKAQGSTAAYQVWFIIETASGIPLDDYYETYPHTSTVGGITVTDFTGSFFSSQLSTCQGGAATVTVSATGGTGPYTGTGIFQQLAGTHTYTVTDANGCTGSGDATVVAANCVELSCVTNKVVNADAGICTATVTGIDPVISPTGSQVNYVLSGATEGTGSGSVSGMSFHQGVTIVTYTSTEEPAKTCSFSVTVNDNQDPAILGLPSDITRSNDVGVCGAVVSWIAPEATDNCSGSSIDQTAGPVPGSTFPIGNTTVTYTATDGAGNMHSESFTVTVKDEEDPTISGFPTDVLKANDLDVCGAVVSWIEPTANDNCPGSTITQTAGPAPGSVFPIGTSTITYEATDAAGNKHSESFKVTVNDAQAPSIIQPDDITVSNGANVCTALVPFQADATDNCGVTSLKFYVNYNTATPVEIFSPRTFAVGSYLITVVAKDAAGNQDVKSFTITVNDDQDPTITAPAPILAQSSDAYQCGADKVHVALGTPSTHDNCHVKQVSNDAPAVFPVGTTTVTWTVEDDAGNTATATQDVTVIDDVKPTITVPHATVSANTSDDGIGDCTVAMAIDNASFDDNCSAEVLSWTFTGVTTGSGNGQVGTKTFNIGETVIHYTATDAALNKAYATVSITVTDNEAPTITGTIPISNIEGCSATAAPAAKTTVAGLETLGISISDNCTADAAMTVTSQDSYSGTCPLVITRTYTIKDAALNPVTVVHTINIDDNTNPQITCATPPVGGFKRKTNVGSCAYMVVSTEFDATATDNCTMPALAWAVTGATSASGNTTMAGHALNFGLNTITWTATDGCGNQSTCVITVNVNEVQTNTVVTVLPIAQKYSDKVTFQATVTPYNCPNAGAIGGTVTFKIGNLSMGSAPVNASGVATLSNVALLEDMLYDAEPNNPMNATSGPLKPGAKIVTAVFSGTDADYIVANPTTPLQVDCEDVDVSYNGQQYFTVNPNNNTGTVSLSSYVLDRDDTPTGARGDVRNATVTFRDGGAAGLVLGTSNIPVGLINTGVTTEGIATTGFNYTLTNSDITNGGQVFDVWMGANNYYCGDAGETVPVTVALPGQDFVTGGGYIKMQNSAGTYAGTPTKRMNFGLVMRWNKSGKSLQGKVTIVYRRVVGGQSKVYQIKSNAINSLVVTNVNDAGAVATGTAITFRKAVISTKANLTDITNPLSPVSLASGAEFTVTAWESTTNTTGALDRVGVQLSGSGSVGLLFSSNWSGGTTQWQKLDGGKMQVRSTTTSTAALTRAIQASTIPIEITQFDLKAYPNPSHASFNIVMSSNNKLDKVQLRIMDISGRTIQVYNNLSANQTLQIGSNYRPGMYIVEMIQDNERKQLKLIKQPN